LFHDIKYLDSFYIVTNFGGSQLGVFNASFFSCIFSSIVLLLPVIAAIMSL